MVLYFAYGSNMSQSRMRERISKNGARFEVIGRAVLKDYELRFNKENTNRSGVGYANVMESPGSVVEGVLYEVDEKGIRVLDRYEGAGSGHYQKEWLTVETEGGSRVSALLYVACPDQVRAGLRPTREYLGFLLEGKSYLSDGYYRKLEGQPTLND